MKLAATREYGLSLGIVTRDVMCGLAAEQIPTGIVHINNQTVNDEANAPFGGVSASGTGSRSRFGSAAANIEAFTPDPLDHDAWRATAVSVLTIGRSP